MMQDNNDGEICVFCSPFLSCGYEYQSPAYCSKLKMYRIYWYQDNEKRRYPMAATSVHKAVSKEFSTITPESAAQEVLVVCPHCKTMETILFSDGHFYTNRKFTETETGLYHDCGSTQPCRFYQNGGRITLTQSPEH